MNTPEAIKNIKLVGGGLALLSVAGLAFAVRRGLNHRRMYNRPFDPHRNSHRNSPVWYQKSGYDYPQKQLTTYHIHASLAFWLNH